MLRVLAFVLAVLAVIFLIVGVSDARIPFILLAGAVLALAVDPMVPMGRRL